MKRELFLSIFLSLSSAIIFSGDRSYNPHEYVDVDALYQDATHKKSFWTMNMAGFNSSMRDGDSMEAQFRWQASVEKARADYVAAHKEWVKAYRHNLWVAVSQQEEFLTGFDGAFMSSLVAEDTVTPVIQDRVNAATTLQRVFRGKQGRLAYNKKREEHAAQVLAFNVPALIRAYKAREVVAELQDEKERKSDRRNATVIQAQVRRMLAVKQVEHEKAVKAVEPQIIQFQAEWRRLQDQRVYPQRLLKFQEEQAQKERERLLKEEKERQEALKIAQEQEAIQAQKDRARRQRELAKERKQAALKKRQEEDDFLERAMKEVATAKAQIAGEEKIVHKDALDCCLESAEKALRADAERRLQEKIKIMRSHTVNRNGQKVRKGSSGRVPLILNEKPPLTEKEREVRDANLLVESAERQGLTGRMVAEVGEDNTTEKMMFSIWDKLLAHQKKNGAIIDPRNKRHLLDMAQESRNIALQTDKVKMSPPEYREECFGDDMLHAWVEHAYAKELAEVGEDRIVEEDLQA